MTTAQLVAWRRRQGMTQAEAAEWYGVHVRSWQRWELGERSIPKPLAQRIALERTATGR